MDCRNLGDDDGENQDWYLRVDPEIACYGKEHFAALGFIVAPMLLFYMIIVPFMVPIYLGNFYKHYMSSGSEKITAMMVDIQANRSEKENRPMLTDE